jgi:hypothetical protein
MNSHLAVVLVLLLSIPTVTDAAPSFEPGPLYEQAWSIEQFFPGRRDFASEIAIGPTGDVYLGGRTEEVYGTPATGAAGGLAARYNGDGQRQWLTMAYTGRHLDHVKGIAVDPTGAVYISGETYRYSSGAEAFVVKFAANGQRLWERHLGSSDNESGGALAIDSLGSVYMTGTTTGKVGPVEYGGYDAFLTKYSASGAPQWTRQYDTNIGSVGESIAIDSNDNLYLIGSGGTSGNSLSMLNTTGDVAWTRYPNYSTISGRTTGIAKVGIDPFGNLLTVGSTNRLYDPARGYIEGDAFVAKHDADGELIWKLVLDSDSVDDLSGIAFDTYGAIYVSGSKAVDAGGSVRNEADAMWSKITPDGTLVFTEVFGTSRNDYSTGIVVDDLGRVFVSGSTSWNVNNYFAGDQDAFLVRFDPNPIPEPSAIIILAALVATAASNRGGRLGSERS